MYITTVQGRGQLHMVLHVPQNVLLQKKRFFLSLSIYLSICVYYFYLYLSLSVSIYRCVSLSISIAVHICLSLCVSICLYVSLCISVYLFISLYISNTKVCIHFSVHLYISSIFYTSTCVSCEGESDSAPMPCLSSPRTHITQRRHTEHVHRARPHIKHTLRAHTQSPYHTKATGGSRGGRVRQADAGRRELHAHIE